MVLLMVNLTTYNPTNNSDSLDSEAVRQKTQLTVSEIGLIKTRYKGCQSDQPVSQIVDLCNISFFFHPIKFVYQYLLLTKNNL